MKDRTLKKLLVSVGCVFNIIAWIYIIAFGISIVRNMIMLDVSDPRVALVIGFILGLVCSLYAINRDDIQKWIERNIAKDDS